MHGEYQSQHRHSALPTHPCVQCFNHPHTKSYVVTAIAISIA